MVAIGKWAGPDEDLSAQNRDSSKFCINTDYSMTIIYYGDFEGVVDFFKQNVLLRSSRLTF